MHLSTLVQRSALLLVAALAPTVAAHDGARFMSQRQAPFAGPIVLNNSSTVQPAFASDGVTLLGWLPLTSFAGTHTSGADSWGYVSPSGTEYAIICLSDGIAFVDVSDPGLPVIVQTLSGVSSLWRDVKIYEDFAYYVSESGDGIQIVDMSQIDSGVVTNVGSVNSAGTTASHNVAINEDSGYLYQLGGGTGPIEGLRIYSLANKANPTFVGEWDDRYIHDAQVVSYTSGPYAGREIAFCFSEAGPVGGSPGVDILDVSNKNNIQSLSQLSYSNSAFSHQGWLSPDKQFLYLNDEFDEQIFGTNTSTHVFDVTDLSSPFEVTTFSSGSIAIDHNLYTKGNLIYEANYRSGLRVFDASNPTSPVETAFFDTYEADDFPAYNGLWNVFPYFDSNTIIGSDMEKGLFIWRLGEPELDFSISYLPDLVSPNGDEINVLITPQPGITLQGGSPTLHLDTGSGFMALPMTNFGGGTYQAAIPALSCGTYMTYYFTAQTTGGVTWHHPAGAPTAVYAATSATSINILASTNLESNAGWTVGAFDDDASTGIWTRVDPIGTAAQPEDDHTDDPGTDCYVTGQGSVGGSLGENDVDDGKTTLHTALFDASSGNPLVRYWRWFSNSTGANPGKDLLIVDISNDAGDLQSANWTTVETVGPTGLETLGGWFQHSFTVSDVILPTLQMRLRFVVADINDGSVVEAAIDDFEVVRINCIEVCQVDLGFGGPGNDQAVPNAPAILFLSLANNPVPFKGGTLVTFPFVVLLSLGTDGTGSITVPVSGGNGPLTIYAQFAIADSAQINGVALSNALEVEFGP